MLNGPKSDPGTWEPANTLKALQERGMIRAIKGHDPLAIVWRLTKKQQ